MLSVFLDVMSESPSAGTPARTAATRLQTFNVGHKYPGERGGQRRLSRPQKQQLGQLGISVSKPKCGFWLGWIIYSDLWRLELIFVCAAAGVQPRCGLLHCRSPAVTLCAIDFPGIPCYCILSPVESPQA